jgi:hypothetical protein
VSLATGRQGAPARFDVDRPRRQANSSPSEFEITTPDDEDRWIAAVIPVTHELDVRGLQLPPVLALVLAGEELALPAVGEPDAAGALLTRFSNAYWVRSGLARAHLLPDLHLLLAAVDLSVEDDKEVDVTVGSCVSPGLRPEEAARIRRSRRPGGTYMRTDPATLRGSSA